MSHFNRKGQDSTEDYPIDFVVTWVDGNDPEWQQEKEKYLHLTDAEVTERENPVQRFRNWENLKYWFRTVEKYAPWVHAVYFVTCGHKPNWLNTDNSKLHFVSHRDFIPSKYLPTFCSDVIELNLWRIKGLSEHFVYFNDDVFLNRPVVPQDFFEHGLPKMAVIAKPIEYTADKADYKRRIMNDYGVINSSLNIKKAIEKNPEKWFAHVIGDDAKYNRRIYEDGYIVGMYSPHMVMPFIKQSFVELWQEQFDILDQSCIGKFRSYHQVTIQLPGLWGIFHGKFVPVEKIYFGLVIVLAPSTINKGIAILRRGKSIAVCLNDSQLKHPEDFETIKDKLIKAFEEKLPEKSSFEK